MRSIWSRLLDVVFAGFVVVKLVGYIIAGDHYHTVGYSVVSLLLLVGHGYGLRDALRRRRHPGTGPTRPAV